MKAYIEAGTKAYISAAVNVIRGNAGNTQPIIAIINSLTGETDTTYEDAMSELLTQFGGEATGVITSDIEELLVIMGTYSS